MSQETIIRAHETRIGALESQMGDMRVTLTKLEGDIRLNNVMTEDIRKTLHTMSADTADGVNLLKGFKVFGRLTAWVVGFAVSITAIIAAINLFVGK